MSIVYRKDRKKFELTLYVDGKRVQRLHFDDEASAERAELEFKMKQLGITPRIIETPIGEGFKKYLDEVTPKKDQETQKNERRWLRMAAYFFTEQGLSNMNDIRLEHLEELQRWSMQDHLIKYFSEEKGKMVEWKIRAAKPQTVNRRFSTYGHVFKKMRQWKRIGEDPCEFLEPLEERDVETRESWDRDAVVKIYRACPTWFRTVFRMVYYYGSRPSSLERAKWSGVLFDRGLIVLDSKKGCKAKTKDIVLPMIPPMRRELLRLKGRFPLVGADMAVFRDDKGRPVTAHRITKTASKIIKECGYGYDFYALRHTLANDLRNAGVDMEGVRDILGHTDTRVTRNYCNEVPAKIMASNILLVRGANNERRA